MKKRSSAPPQTRKRQRPTQERKRESWVRETAALALNQMSSDRMGGLEYPERWFKVMLVGSFSRLLLGYYLNGACDLSVCLGMGLLIV